MIASSRLTAAPDWIARLILAAVLFASAGTCWEHARGQSHSLGEDVVANSLQWQSLPDLPGELGVAGPFAGVHNDALIVAGGANFPEPVWETSKVWHDAIYVLTESSFGSSPGYAWSLGGKLPRPIAYGASVSTPQGVICMGGNDAEETFREVFLLQWDAESGKVTRSRYPSLPEPCAYAQAALIGNVVYLAGGQSGSGLETAMKNLWALDLSQRDDPSAFRWRELPPWPGPARAFHITAAQHNGYDDCLYVLSGRCQDGGEIRYLTDVWEFTPSTLRWRRRAEVPRCVMAGTGIGAGQSHLFIFGGDDGSLFLQADQLQDQHPGFRGDALAYHTITDTWTSLGEQPENQVTTKAVRWDDRIIIPSGEVRPRVRTTSVWSVQSTPRSAGFGVANYIVLIAYLIGVVAIGVYFTRRNRNTNDYFRGGQHIPWWAAGCSIFATMLSSLTYTGLPAKAYAQDWVYAVGNFLIPVVAVVAVFVVLPFYRRIDATSAYQYLENRFDRRVRWFASASFTVFHVFRMAIVLSLTGLALAVATPLSPAQSVLLMGVLSILYCTLGGIEAVVWTDTVQTFVLLGGAIVALGLLLAGTEGDSFGVVAVADSADKFRMANLHWDATTGRLALWVVVIGAFGQHLSSYSADQAVVQRYMTTSDERRAAGAIWTNALLAIPATLLVFGIGTALFAFYRTHPERLDPTMNADQIFPYFIAQELPAGLAGLIVAGIFAAAQSTVSTSINSTATTIITDFLRPLNWHPGERFYLFLARLISVLMGTAGTLLGLGFVDPEIRSLFDAFVQVIGLFMGILGGLFILGVLTRRANAIGALAGALTASVVLFTLWRFAPVTGYLYAAIGITTCVTAGYAASLVSGGEDRDLTGLTLFTRRSPTPAHPVDPAPLPESSL